MARSLFRIVAAILGLYLAQEFVPGVKLEIIPGQSSVFGFQLTAFWQILILVGGILGIFNSFIKPIIKTITLPLRIITFGLFSLILNMLIIWLLDIFFLELTITGLIPLFWTTVIIWAISWFLGR